jgi:hypothetical protein
VQVSITIVNARKKEEEEEEEEEEFPTRNYYSLVRQRK